MVSDVVCSVVNISVVGANVTGASVCFSVVGSNVVVTSVVVGVSVVGSDVVDALVSTIEVNNLETIVSFGAEAAEEVSKASDIVLNSMSMSQIDESNEMLSSLSKIMSKFDIDEL